MGGRGGSFGNGHTGRNAIRQFSNGSDVIDLSESPLIYGSTDKGLRGNARNTIEQFENSRWQNRIEYSRFVDEQGNVIEDNKGGRGSVRASFEARRSAFAMSHNHPREAGMLGGTFSVADIANFGEFAQKTYRATAKEGTYSITKGKNFDAKGLKTYYKSVDKKVDVEYNKRTAAIWRNVESRKITVSEAHVQEKKAFNKILVDMHNALRAGQKKYGYTYTLERRGTNGK